MALSQGLVMAAVIFAVMSAADAGRSVVTEGLVLFYDFAAGSLPDEAGVVKDLSGNGIDGAVRPSTATMPDIERTGWSEHRVLQGDGEGGWVTRPALIQELKQPGSDHTMPFGIVAMDNGEIAIICSWEKKGLPTRPIIAFSKDGGDTWSEFVVVEGAGGRPINLTYHGGGTLSFVTGRRYYSHDYGRTWPENVEHPKTKTGMTFHLEGNAWVDRDKEGGAKAILELGWHYTPGKTHPTGDATVVFRRSVDGGLTWIDEVAPPEWKFTMEHKGKKWLRGVSEGAIVRAENGDLVAALRTDIPPHFFDGPHNDNLEGTAISVSQDDGKTWSAMNFLFWAGRHHANLQRLPNGDLVCTMVVRDDVQDGKLASHRRGCDAVVSLDNGRTWNLDRRYELDRFEYYQPAQWLDGQCGHIGAAALADGSVISAYGNYVKGAAVLVKWKPGAEPALAATELDLAALPVEGASILDQVARRGRDYEVGEGALVLKGTGWIQVPSDERVLSLAGEGTIELVLRPEAQGGMPVLVSCNGANEGGEVYGFTIAYDQRGEANNTQAIYSDQRVKQEEMEYSIQVPEKSTPKPFAAVLQQLAYVMKDGHGRFYRNGIPFSEQTETEEGSGSLFRYVSAKGVSPEDVRIGIGARPFMDHIGQGLRGELYAVRIYDRALGAGELRRNFEASGRPRAAANDE